MKVAIMPKHFANLPESLEQHNPETICLEDFPFEETQDENGQYHSFNDQPALIYSIEDENQIFIWYNHGVISREDNKPSMIVTSKTKYATSNSSQQLHSFNDDPAEMQFYYGQSGKSLYVTWMKNGELHRENNLPAIIVFSSPLTGSTVWSKVKEQYYLNGELHRGMGEPAYSGDDSKKWVIFGGLHNQDGFALEGYSDEETPYQWRAL